VTESRPFVRFVGGKTQLLPELRKHVPADFGSYFEPFVGGGAMFWDLAASGRLVGEGRVELGDMNEALVVAYSWIRDDVDAVIASLTGLAIEHAGDAAGTFKREVAATVGWCSCALCAARFIYLLKTDFNGLWRTNQSGRFNVPIGKFTKPPTICDEPLLRACSAVLQGVCVMRQDFVVTMADAKAGDLVYCDCPYWPVNETSNFTGYTKGGFTRDDQVRLRDMAWLLKQRGVHVLLSNADVTAVRELYKDFEIHAVQARRNVNSKASARGAVGEVIIR
jgi:DNA adenine methylase